MAERSPELKVNYKAIVFDFDGVFRHFDPLRQTVLENKYQLAPGSLYEAAFTRQDYLEVAKGELTKQDWIGRTGKLLGNNLAAKEFLEDQGTLDGSMVRLLEDIKQTGTSVALLTNSTCTIHDELEMFGLLDSFDYLFTTNTIGMAKPNADIFGYVCKQMSVSPGDVFFTDDLTENINGAREVGFTAELFTSPEATRELLLK